MDTREILVKLCTPLDRMFRKGIFNSLFFWYARRKLKLDVLPKVLKIEATNYCNASCVFCPYDKMTRPKGNMSQELFEKIITEATDNGIMEIEFVHMGETLIDPNIFEKIRMAKSKGMRTQMVSNGSLFSHKKIEEMFKSGLDILKISFEGYNEEIYRALRPGLDYHKIVDNLKAIMRYKKENGYKYPFIIIRIIYCPEHKKELDEFVLCWSDIVDDIEILPLHNWTNLTDYKASSPITCIYPWTHMTILQDGRVVPCTVEWEGKNTIGDLKHESLVNIWKGAKVKEVRQSLLDKKMQQLALCCHCDIPYSENRLNYLNQLLCLRQYPNITVLRKV